MAPQYSVVYPKRDIKAVPIDVWADAVVNSDKITLTRDDSYITEIYHYKNSGGMEHEHLRAKCIVRDGSTTHTSWIHIDRTRGPRADNVATDNASHSNKSSPTGNSPSPVITPNATRRSNRSSLTAASSYSSEVSLGCFPQHTACDLISVVRVDTAKELINDKEKLFIVDKITVSNKLALPVAHFAALVRLISESKELYHPQNQNCYEFSAAIVECVLSGCPRPGFFARQPVTNHHLRGRFRTMDISTPSKISSPEILNKLHKAWKEGHDAIDGMLSSAQVSPNYFLNLTYNC
jgi:hypothetical protein